MPVLVVHKESCKASRYWIEACPKQALYTSEHINEKGYQATDVHEDKCIACGTCFIVCPDYVFELPGGE